jgi:hypothetical protein
MDLAADIKGFHPAHNSVPDATCDLRRRKFLAMRNVHEGQRKVSAEPRRRTPGF